MDPCFGDQLGTMAECDDGGAADGASSSSSSLIVFHIPSQLTSTGLENAFAQHGTVQRAVVKKDRLGNSIGFVDMASSNECVRAIAAMHNRPPLNWSVKTCLPPRNMTHDRSISFSSRPSSPRQVPGAGVIRQPVPASPAGDSKHKASLPVDSQRHDSWPTYDSRSDTRWQSCNDSGTGKAIVAASAVSPITTTTPTAAAAAAARRQVVYEPRLATLERRPCAVCAVPTAGHCGRCKRTRYCSRQCQQQDWHVHAVECREPELPALLMAPDTGTPADTTTVVSQAAAGPTPTVHPVSRATAGHHFTSSGLSPQSRRQLDPSSSGPPSSATNHHHQQQQQQQQSCLPQNVGTSRDKSSLSPLRRPAAVAAVAPPAIAGATGRWQAGGATAVSVQPLKQTPPAAPAPLNLNIHSKQLVYVSHVVNANTVYVQPCDNRERYLRMERQLQPVAALAPAFAASFATAPAQPALYLAQFESAWYRACLLPSDGASAPGTRLVRFIDWGNTAAVPLATHLRQLPPPPAAAAAAGSTGVGKNSGSSELLQQLVQLPALAVCVQLDWSSVRGVNDGGGGGGGGGGASVKMAVAARLQDAQLLASVCQQLVHDSRPPAAAAAADLGHELPTAVVTLTESSSGKCALQQCVDQRQLQRGAVAARTAPTAHATGMSISANPSPAAPVGAQPVPSAAAPATTAAAGAVAAAGGAATQHAAVLRALPDNLVLVCRAGAVTDHAPSAAAVLQCVLAPFLTTDGATVDWLLPLTGFHADTVERLELLTVHCSTQQPLQQRCLPGDVVAVKELELENSFLRAVVLADNVTSYCVAGIDFGSVFTTAGAVWSLPDPLTLSRCTPLLICASSRQSSASLTAILSSADSDGDVELQLLTQLPAPTSSGGQQLAEVEARAGLPDGSSVPVQLHGCRHLIGAITAAIATKRSPTAAVGAAAAAGGVPAAAAVSRSSSVSLHQPPAAVGGGGAHYSCAQLSLCSTPLTAGDSYQFLPTRLVHPQLLIGQLLNTSCQQLLRSVTDQLSVMCQHSAPPATLPPIGALLAVHCCCRDNDSGPGPGASREWRRGRLVHRQEQLLLVQLVDWGHTVAVPLADCRPLPEPLCSVETLEMHVGLFSLASNSCPADQLPFFADKLLWKQHRMLIKSVLNEMPQAVLYRENGSTSYVFNDRMLSRLGLSVTADSTGVPSEKMSHMSVSTELPQSPSRSLNNGNRSSPGHATPLPLTLSLCSPPAPVVSAPQPAPAHGSAGQTLPTPAASAPSVVASPHPAAAPPPAAPAADVALSSSVATMDSLPAGRETQLLTPAAGAQLAVLVCDVAGGGHFTATPLTDTCLQQLDRLEAAIDQLQLSQQPSPAADSQLQPDQLAMVLTDVGQGPVWCRATVLERTPAPAAGAAAAGGATVVLTVYLIDHGTVTTVSDAETRAIDASLLHVPALAVNICLTGALFEQLNAEQLQLLEQLLADSKERGDPLDLEIVAFDADEQLFSARADQLLKQLLPGQL